MRSHQFVTSLLGVAAWLSLEVMASGQTPFGVHPRATPGDYAASQQAGTATYAASLVSADEVKHIFAADISKIYVVFEVACYPVQPDKVVLDPSDFLVKVGADSEFVHPADAVTVASVVQQKNAPKPPSNKPVVYTASEVGYESGTDPYTGQRVHGVYTANTVGIRPDDATPPFPPPAGSTPQDRATLQYQLAQRALPQGSFASPVAGFLYFPAKEIKKKANGAYELQYLKDPSVTVRLEVPAKAH